MKSLWPNALLGISYVSRAIKPSVLLVTTLLASATYAITAPTNTAPELTVSSAYSANEEEAFVFQATAEDDMLPAGVLTFSLIDAPEGAVINPTTGEFTWTPAELPGPDQTPYTFMVRVSDTELYTERLVTITVNKVNRAPVFNVIGDKTVNEKATLTFNVSATGTDLPPASLVFSAPVLPRAQRFTTASSTGHPLRIKDPAPIPSPLP